MIFPLTLKRSPKFALNDIPMLESSPLSRRRADSLVFSITSEKQLSPKETILLESKQQAVSKELQSLHLKLQCLQSKVSNINSQQVSAIRNMDLEIKTESNYRKNKQKPKISNFSDKQNINQTNKVGKIVKKTSKSHTIKTSDLKFKSTLFQSSARTKLATNQSFVQKQREVQKMRKQVQLMKRSIQKTQRSKSLCSQKLSNSKSMIKKMKTKEKKQEQTVVKLKADLKKSQNIRQKQKNIILTQQKQIQNLVKQVAALTKLR